MQFFHGTNIDFVGKRQMFFIVSIAVIVLGLLGTMLVGVEYGIDFKGGAEIGIKFSQPVEASAIRTAIETAGMDGSEIKSFGKEGSFLIRVKSTGDASEVVVNALKTAMPNNELEILKSDVIGPKIGDEMRGDAFFAVLLSVLAILGYIAFRFEFAYGLGAVVALVHDVFVTFAIIVLFNKLGFINLEVNMQILAAMLTVVGFSINDTVIIFDRIRENKDRHKGLAFTKLVNTSINETLSRTVITVLTTALVLLTLVTFGGPVLEGFAFVMLIGIITGTYSSIYIASSFVIFFLEKNKKIDAKTGKLITESKLV